MADGEATITVKLVDLASRGIKGFTDAFFAAKTAVFAFQQTFGRAIGFIQSSLKAFSEQEEAVNKLNHALKNQGAFTQEMSQHLQGYASEMQKTTRFTDEQILENQALLVSFGMVGNQLKNSTQAAADLSAGLGIDLRTSSMLLGKAFDGNAEALGRYGIKVKEGLTGSAAFKDVLDQINKKFGGRAAADAGTYAGKIDQLSKAFNELQERIGKGFVPMAEFVISWANRAIGAFDKLIDKVGQYTNANTTVADGLREQLRQTIETSTQEGTFHTEATQRKIQNIQSLLEAERAAETERAVVADKKLNDELAREGISRAADEESKKKAQERTRTLTNYTKSAFGELASFQGAKSKEISRIAKTAAIAEATISTYSAAAGALAAKPVGPWNFALAALFTAAGLANVARISGTQLARGGMVMPTSGGTSAIIGEGGKAEAVIPLNDDRTKDALRETLGGESLVININAGTIVASEYAVEEFAQKIDEKLFMLKRNRRSVS